MRSRIARLFLIAAAILSITAGCQSEMPDATGKAKIIVGSSVGSRTLLPQTETPDSYNIVLKQNGEEKWKTEKPVSAVDGAIEISGMELGSYQVYVEGLDAEGKKILRGEGSSDLVVSASATGSVIVKLGYISDEGTTGSIEVTFSWPDLASTSQGCIREALDDGGLKFVLLAGDDYEETASYEYRTNADGDTFETQVTCRFDDVPTGTDVPIAFRIQNIEGRTLIDAAFYTRAQVYAGHTSVVDSNDEGLFEITANMNTMSPRNVTRLDIDYPMENTDSSLIVKITNPSMNYINEEGKKDKKPVNVKVLLSWQKADGTSPESEPVEVPASAVDVEYTATGLEPGVEYKFFTQTVYDGNLISEKRTWEGTEDKPFCTKVGVKDIDLDDSGITDDIIVQGSSFTIDTSITPSNASIKTVTYTESNKILERDTFADAGESGNKALFTAILPGKTTITATSDDPLNKISKTSKEIKVRLAAPKNVAAVQPETDLENGEVSVSVYWDKVEGAEQYIVYRSDKTEAIATVTETYYSDKALKAGESYSYQIVADAPEVEATAGFKVISDKSETSNTVSIDAPRISIILPSTTEGTIEIKQNGEGNNLLPDQTIFLSEDDEVTVTVSNPEFSGGFEAVRYAWYVNGASQEKNELRNTSSFEEMQTFVISSYLEGVDQMYMNEVYYLTFAAYGANGEVYSKTITFTIATPIIGVTLTAPNAKDKALRLTTESDTLQLEGKVVFEGDRTSDSENLVTAQLNTLSYTVSGDESCVEVKDGLVTIKGYGDVRITATAVNGMSDYIDLSIYTPTVQSEAQLIDAVNRELRKYLEYAENSFVERDWWGSWTYVLIGYANGDQQSYGPIDGISIKNSHGTSIKPGLLNIDNHSFIGYGSIGQLTINAATALELYATSAGDAGYLSVDNLGKISTNNAVIDVTLPYNQGVAHIRYNSIEVADGENKNVRNGSYDVSFDSIIGPNPTNPLEDGNFPDASTEGISKIYY